jgi:hypothetical protein
VRLPLCDSAKQGKVCIDDLCRGNPDNTLCGFDQSEYDQITRDYDDEEADFADDFDEQDELEDAMQNCGMMQNGICMKAGSEECDWECPFSPG